jgi:S-methylmethionine-dependent homocysteine/selenocysteine methylase
MARRNSIVTYRTTDARLINFSVALAYQVLKIVKERDLVEILGREAQLAVTVCDLIGVETLPNLIENRVLRQILSEYIEQDPRAVVGLKTIMDHCTEHPQISLG